MTFSLVAHRESPGCTIRAVTVELVRLPDSAIDLVFEVSGAVLPERWDDLQEQAFADDLWRNTCFEAFLQVPGDDAYIELNFAPSMLWAAYSFDEYRSGMRPLRTLDPVTAAGWSPAWAWLGVGMKLPMLPATKSWSANFTAVIEETDGTKSYWALAHAPGPPDFHNRDCFIATLPAPTDL